MKKMPFDFRRSFQSFEKLVSKLADTCIRNGENSDHAVSNLRRVLSILHKMSHLVIHSL